LQTDSRKKKVLDQVKRNNIKKRREKLFQTEALDKEEGVMEKRGGESIEKRPLILLAAIEAEQKIFQEEAVSGGEVQGRHPEAEGGEGGSGGLRKRTSSSLGRRNMKGRSKKGKKKEKERSVGGRGGRSKRNELVGKRPLNVLERCAFSLKRGKD